MLRGEGVLMEEPPIAGALCYEAELVNVKTGRIIGAGIDCLENIVLIGDGVALDCTTECSLAAGPRAP